MRAPAGFHRIQGIQIDRSTLSTVGLYDLYTRYGQSVDKKALLLHRRNYPQVPPQPQGALYRGFQLYKSLLKHADSAFFHEIWPYHHHHALDLYPDLEARIDPISSKRVLWTVAFPEAAATPSKTIASAPHVVADGTPIKRRDAATAILITPDPTADLHRRMLEANRRPRSTPTPLNQRLSQSEYQCSTWNKKTPGNVPGVVRFHVEQR